MQQRFIFCLPWPVVVVALLLLLLLLSFM